MAVTVTNDVVYSPDLNLTLDVFVPDNPNHAAILDIHGGGWFRGDKSKEAPMAERFAEAGFVVFVPNYRLAPKTFFPAAREDVLQAYSWLKESDYDFNRDKIAVFGSSAGGSLSVDVGLATGIPTVSWSGIFDIKNWFESHPDVVAQPDTHTDFVKTASAQIDQGGRNDPFYKWFILNYVDSDETKFDDVEPFKRVTEKAGPMYLANSLQEIIPTSGVTSLADALAKANVPVMTQFVTGGKHAEGYVDKAWDYTLAFYKQYLEV